MYPQSLSSLSLKCLSIVLMPPHCGARTRLRENTHRIIIEQGSFIWAFSLSWAHFAVKYCKASREAIDFVALLAVVGVYRT